MGNEVGLMDELSTIIDVAAYEFPSPMWNEVGLMSLCRIFARGDQSFRPLWGMR